MRPAMLSMMQEEDNNAVNDARGRQLLDSKSVEQASKVQEKSAFNLPNDQGNSNESNQPNYISGAAVDEGNDNGDTVENDPYNHYRGSTIDNHHQVTIDDFRRMNPDLRSHP
ncbi:hypothetical protein AMTR_s00009p00120180 [Amborella trichopoda]|uniref:Uncharacterized protein n=1 Tax=Amborella trichopoda TaxID=13333 RepID=W1NGF0_AMBTC|nr:hypothetical protein AMTR_s00009p00120180 [Amborella trichopoda]